MKQTTMHATDKRNHMCTQLKGKEKKLKLAIRVYLSVCVTSVCDRHLCLCVCLYLIT